MSSKRHGTAEHRAQPLRSIPKVTRPMSDFGVEEHTLVDVSVSARAQRDEGLIPSITGKAARVATGKATPPNVIPFTKPRAMAAVVAANPKALVIEKSVAKPTIDEPTTPFSAPPVFAHQTPPVTDAARATNPRVSTGWTPPGAVPTVPVGAQTLYGTAPAAKTVVPVPALTARSVGPAIAVPPIEAPRPVAYVAPVAAYPVTPAPAAAAPAPIAWFTPAAPAVSSTPPMAPAPAPAPAPIAHQEPMLAQPANKWAVFEKLGLGAPKINTQKLIVSAYRMLGFAILTIIVVVLVGYIANTAFFYLSSSWVVPMQVSATDEKVVALQAQLSEQQNSRDRLADELNQAERSIAAQQSFQLEFAKAIKLDLDGRKAALDRVRALANNAASTRRAIKSQNAAYAGNARRRMKQEFEAGLIDRNAMLSGGVQLAALTSSNLSLAERQAEFETRAAELEATTKSLDAILSNVDGDSALSYEVLRIKQEYAASRLDLAKAIEARNTLKSSLGRQDKIVSNLKRSSHLRAVEDGAAVAFVPYGNLSNVEKGSSVYACRVGMVLCYHVGEVIEVLPGEVQFKHPQRDKMLRGQMVEMRLDDEDDDAAAGDVLYIGGKPLFI